MQGSRRQRWLGRTLLSGTPRLGVTLTQTDEKQLKASWFDFANRLYPVGVGIFNASAIKITDQGTADIRIVGLMVLARTLRNLKAAILLANSGFIVEAKVVTRCCFENSYWIGALLREGDKFRSSMVQHEIKHKRMRAQTLVFDDWRSEGRNRGQVASVDARTQGI